MKKIMITAGVAGAVLALSACGANEEAAPAEPVEPVEAEMMAPAEEEPAADSEETTEEPGEELDPTGNPIGPT
ncbi:MAG: hypothetical protein ACXIT4_11710 [Erythrobacter sp.]